MTVQIGKDVFGVAKQSAKGTLVAQPTFAHGLAGGTLKPDITQEEDPLTSTYLSPNSAFRDGVESGGTPVTRAFVKSVGLYLLGVLGNIASVGTGPYTHTIDLGAALPYLSCYQKKGDTAATIVAVRDCKVDALTLSWEQNKPVVLEVAVKGTTFSFPADFTPSTDETDSVDYFRPVGGTFKLDVDSASPVTAPIKAGSIAVKRSVETTVYSGSIEPADSDEGKCEVEVSFTIHPADLTDWRAILTGTPDGTTVSNVPIFGSFEHTFVSGEASLKLAAGKVAFLTDLPDADPAGGAADFALAGLCYRVSGTPITATLVNTQASY